MKIAFFGSVYRGHNVAPRKLINNLANKGYDITYFAPKKYEDVITKMNVTFSPYPEPLNGSLDYLLNSQLPTSGDANVILRFLTETTVDAAVELVPWTETQLQKQDFNLVLYDNMAIWGYVAAQNLDLVNYCSITIMATNTNIMKETGEGAIYLTLDDYVSAPLKLLHNKGNDIASFNDIMTCEYNHNKLLYTSKHFQSNQAYFPDDEYVFFPSRCFNESPGEKLVPDNLKIFISFGTIYNSDVSLFKDIIGNIANNNYEIIVSAGRNNATFHELVDYNIFPNVAIEMFVDQDQVLKNTDLFITHAGLNSVSEAICQHIPMITIPLVGDQHNVASSLAQLNAGYLVPRTQVKNDINIAINHVVENWESYQNNLFTIRESFEDYNVIESALERVIGVSDIAAAYSEL